MFPTLACVSAKSKACEFCSIDVQPFGVCNVVMPWRIHFPPSDALRLNRGGPPCRGCFLSTKLCKIARNPREGSRDSSRVEPSRRQIDHCEDFRAPMRARLLVKRSSTRASRNFFRRRSFLVEE
jgi:hypothetical protein